MTRRRHEGTRGSRPRADGGSWRGYALAASLLLVVCLLAFWNGLRAQLLLDSQAIILKDPRLRSLDWQAIHDIFTHHYWWPSLESRLFRPLTTLSYWFNYSVLGNGPQPLGYLAVNLLLHWTNAVLAWSLVRAVSGRRWLSLFAAAVVACHPVTVESVANVVGRADLLAALSVLAGLWIYRRYLTSRGTGSRWLGALGATALAGVCCKESAVVLPAAMVLLHAALPPASSPSRGHRPLARAWPAYLAVAPALVALFSARWLLFRYSPLAAEFGSDNVVAAAPYWTGLMTAVKVAGYYLGLFAWPARLSCDYSYNAVTMFGWTLSEGQDLHAWIALALLAGLAGAAAIAWDRDRALFFFLGFAAIAYLPVSNLVIPIGTIMAERLLYLPLVGLAAAASVAVAAAVERARDRLPDRARGAARFAVVAGALAVVAALTMRTVERNEDWTSAERLWSASARATPDSIKVIRAQASLVMDSDPSGARAGEAIAIAQRGLEIAERAPLPLYHRPAALYDDVGRYYLAMAHNLAASGNPASALSAARQAVAALKDAEAIDQEINRQGRLRLARLGNGPDEVRDTVTAGIYRNLGAAYLAAGDPTQALVTLSYLQRVQPDSDESHYGVGVAEGAMADFEAARGRYPEARAHLDASALALIEAVLLNPSHDAAWQTLRHVYDLAAPSTEAVRLADGKPALVLDHPLVALHFQQARVALVRQLRAAGLSAAAARWQERTAAGGSKGSR